MSLDLKKPSKRSRWTILSDKNVNTADTNTITNLKSKKRKIENTFDQQEREANKPKDIKEIDDELNEASEKDIEKHKKLIYRKLRMRDRDANAIPLIAYLAQLQNKNKRSNNHSPRSIEDDDWDFKGNERDNELMEKIKSKKRHLLGGGTSSTCGSSSKGEDNDNNDNDSCAELSEGNILVSNLKDCWEIEKESLSSKNKGKKKRKELEQKLSSTVKYIEEKTPSLQKILSSSVDQKTKADLAILLSIAEGIDDSCLEKYELIKQIQDTLDEDKNELSTQAKKIKEDLDKMSVDKKNMEETILLLNIPSNIKKIIQEKYKMLVQSEADTNSDSESRGKLVDWMNYALKIPTEAKPIIPPGADILQCLQTVKKNLDSKLYGMQKEKEDLLIQVHSMLKDPKSKELNLALIGNAGIGKTKLVRSLAESFDIPFVQISLGGCRDVGYLDGCSPAWIGGSPGMILKSVCKMGSKSGIIFFDEVDKIENSSHGREVLWSLLHIIDPVQNHHYQDKWMVDYPIDLSHIWWVFSMNDWNKLNHILRDRMNPIKLADPTKEQKVQIVKRFSIPSGLANTNFQPGEVIFSDEIIKWMVEKRSVEEPTDHGLRGLNNYVNNILRKLSLIKTIYIDSKESKELKDIPCVDDANLKQEDAKIKQEDIFALTFFPKKLKLSIPLVLTQEIVEQLLQTNPTNDVHSDWHSMFN